MKYNLLLTLILISLITFTYFFQEKKTLSDELSQSLESQLFPENLNKIQIAQLTAFKKVDRWYFEDILLSKTRLTEIEKKIKQIKKIKTISGDKGLFFSSPLAFQVNNRICQIGDLSFDQQSFYVSCDKEIFLCVIDGESQQLTSNSSEIASIKYDELKRLLSLNINQLKEDKIFYFLPDLNMSKAIFSSDGAPSFVINFVDNMTTPGPLAGIEVHAELMEKFKTSFHQLSALGELNYKDVKPFKKLSMIEIFFSDQSFKLELWQMNKNSADAVISCPQLQKAWRVSGRFLKIFFLHVQDFWDKKVIPSKAFNPQKEIKLSLFEQNKQAEVFVKNTNPFQFDSSLGKLNQQKWDFFIQYIFNLGQKDQADRISIFTPSEQDIFLKQNILNIKVFGQHLLIWRRQQELIVANLTQGFKAHYVFLEENFSARFDDMLK